MNRTAMDFKAIAEELLPQSLTLLKQWFPAGKLNGREYKIGNLQGEPGKSLSVNIDTGLWADFSTNHAGNDLISLYAAIHGIKQIEAAKRLGGVQEVVIDDEYVTGQFCHPLPRHPLGKPVAVYEYRNYEGEIYGYVGRFEPINAKKEFFPLSCWKKPNGSLVWKWQKWKIDSLPYQAELIKKHPEAKIMIVAGEGKKLTNAQKLLGDGWIVLAWCNGDGAVGKTDWSALKGRNVWIWPDADESCAKAAETLKKILPQLSIIELPEGLDKGWDLGNAPDDFDINIFINEIPKKEVKRISAKKPELPFVTSESSKSIVKVNGHKYPGVVMTSVHNILLLVENDTSINDCLIYNIFADDVFFVKPPPWEKPEDFKIHPLRDDEIINFRAWVETRGLKCSRNDAFDILISIARRCIINPPLEYFDKLIWDKKPRLDNWLPYYLGAESQPIEYLNLVGSKWMIGVVARIYDPGCKFDTVLILEGDQYLGKSRALETLATVEKERYFTDETIDFKSKDSLIILQGKLIVEMPELAAFRKSDTETIKGFITRRVDEYRPPYGRKTVLRPRMFTIAGSVNPNAGYLTDPTGNRRYWPVACGKKIDLDALERDKEQLWAEAVHRYKSGERIWLLENEYELAKIEQSERVIEDVITDKIINIANQLIRNNIFEKDFFLHELIDKLELPVDRLSIALKTRVCDILTIAGFCEYKPRIDGKQKRKWHLREILPETTLPH